MGCGAGQRAATAGHCWPAISTPHSLFPAQSFARTAPLSALSTPQLPRGRRTSNGFSPNPVTWRGKHINIYKQHDRNISNNHVKFNRNFKNYCYRYFFKLMYVTVDFGGKFIIVIISRQNCINHKQSQLWLTNTTYHCLLYFVINGYNTCSRCTRRGKGGKKNTLNQIGKIWILHSGLSDQVCVHQVNSKTASKPNARIQYRLVLSIFAENAKPFSSLHLPRSARLLLYSRVHLR